MSNSIEVPQNVDPRPARTRAHVLATARRMVAGSTGMAITWSSLSLEAKVARRTLYANWTSLEELLTELLPVPTLVTASDATRPSRERLRNYLVGMRTLASDRVDFTVTVTAARAEKIKARPHPDASIYAIIESRISDFQATVAPLSREQYFVLVGPIVYQELFSLEPTSDATLDTLVEIGIGMIEGLAAAPAPSGASGGPAHTGND